jgi:hypothetical protein
MNCCAVVIGVDRTDGLPRLNAAASGAKAFAQWCQSQSISVTLLDDADGKTITADLIYDAVGAFLQDPKTKYDQLIIYFAGHGVLKAPGAEAWLLSQAPRNPNQAINVPLSIEAARNTPLQHVVFISDACRSISSQYSIAAIQGQVIFPSNDPAGDRAELDQLYATIPGDPAHEVATDDAVKVYRGVYSDVLIKGLRGEDDSVPLSYKGRWLVCARGLKPYLKREVGNAMAAIDLTRRQVPDTRSETEPPLRLAELVGWQRGSEKGRPEDRAAPGPDGPDSGWRGIRRLEKTEFDPVTGMPIDHDLARKMSEAGQQRPATPRKPQAKVKRNPHPQRVRRLRESINRAHGRKGFETGFGFSVVGDQVKGVLTPGPDPDLFLENQTTHIRLHGDSPFDAVIIFEDGSATVLPAWQGYVGTLYRRKGMVANVNYTPNIGTYAYTRFNEVASRRKLDSLRAEAAARAANGRFDVNMDEALRIAEELRDFKAFDPTLGLYAAYAYASGGKPEGVRSILDYMLVDVHRRIPLDLLILGELLGKSDEPHTRYPLLTQGWLLIRDQQWEHLAPETRELQRHLRPALWATFEPDAVDILMHVFS